MTFTDFETNFRSAKQAHSKRQSNGAAETATADKMPPWPILNGAALHGLAGDVVQTIEPHSESDPIAILVQVLAAAGNIIGRRVYYQVESDRHHPVLFATLVGQSSKARKGTSWGRVASVAKIADPTWAETRCKGGLSSGEGLIDQVRDEVTKYDAKAGQWDVIDPGIADKRLMVIEPEFAGALAVMERHGNTLSPLLRKAWDGDKLATMTRASPLTATGAHVSIIAHITEPELRARLTRTDAANGFANRFLFPLVRRSKELPFGGDLTDSQILELGERLRSVCSALDTVHRFTMTDAARAHWQQVYHELSADKPGLLGSVTARAEAQTVRLALIYAALDGAQQIDMVHLSAGLAVWRYCDASAARIFGDATGDPVTDDLLRGLRAAGKDGLTRTAIRDLFGRHQSADRISVALAGLMARGLARREDRSTAGRPIEYWFATDA